MFTNISSSIIEMTSYYYLFIKQTNYVKKNRTHILTPCLYLAIQSTILIIRISLQTISFVK